MEIKAIRPNQDNEGVKFQLFNLILSVRNSVRVLVHDDPSSVPSWGDWEYRLNAAGSPSLLGVCPVSILGEPVP